LDTLMDSKIEEGTVNGGLHAVVAVARYDHACDASKTTTSAYRPKALSTAGLLRIARGRWW
jgi:hypothetical protein